MTVYWLRWHCHVKDISGEPYKIKQVRQKRRQSVAAGRQQLYCAVQSRSPDHCQTTTEKVQSSVRDETSSATVHSWQTTTGCRFHARAEASGKARSPSVERLVDQHGCISRAQTTSIVDVRCREKAISEVGRRCSMKAALSKNAQPECDSLQNSQPMEKHDYNVQHEFNKGTSLLHSLQHKLYLILVSIRRCNNGVLPQPRHRVAIVL